MRVKQMHDRLMIADAQEAQWGKVAQTMNDNAKTMDKLTQARIDRAKDMTAVDDLKSYGEITEAHAEGIRTLTPVFATLYASMSDPQKKQADMMFRHGDRRGDRHGMYKNRHHKRGPNLPPAN
ncbi:MAG: Spy/CpxP family protein refolding chaperone [Dechloromonas sp.]|uniref:Spy/CpxP family protein refolding chaperone n=1 Tax=Candidatus Dechloromonas phosphorivorans TaxID=2899244 RepID=A0A935MW21_9RHOO|nr:Spy/CpxP family protein refolding chaperone [Candidatus Dechloromonas phosphorivorans]